MIFFSALESFSLISSRCYNSATALHFLQLSLARRSLQLAKQSHTQIISFGLNSNPFVITKLITAYAICGHATQSHLVFNTNQYNNVYLYNSLISGYVKNQAYNEAFELFSNMLCCSDVSPDDFTLATMAKVCGEIKDLNVGKSIHGQIIKAGFVEDIVVANSLMSMYVKCGKFSDSVCLFDEMPQRNVGSWNVLISGSVNTGNFSLDKDLLTIVRDMQIDGFKFDAYTVSSLLTLCGGNYHNSGKCDYGRELHCYIIRNELDISCNSDLHLDCCLIDMYSRNNNLFMGKRVFDRMKCRNVYAWTAMINGYVQNGALDEALVLFREMQVKDRIEPNKVSLVSVLPACSSLGGLMGGKQIHGFAIRKEMNHDVSLCNALIDMYSKCGSLVCARQIFEDRSFHKDAISWSSIISGYGLHGKGEEAVILYNKMLSLGNKPDTIAVVGVLSACGRAGLTNEGLFIYDSVINVYGLKPTIEICACVVDMLGRAGLLDRALDFIKTMPVEPGPSVWGALVSASVMHGNSEMQDLAYRSLIQLEPENPSNYVSLSNLYASTRRWDVAAEVRTMMKDRGLKKSPGCSWISINGKTHAFCVSDKSHPCSDSIYEMLDDLILNMKGAGYSPDLQMISQPVKIDKQIISS